MLIGVTDTMNDSTAYQRYISWLSGGTAPVKCRTLSYAHDEAGAADHCDGIVLTGGGDVDPATYGGISGHPALHDVDPKRDSFERGVLDRALARGIPLLGICRGLQIANVHLGGTLIPDLEEAGYSGHRAPKGAECAHPVLLEGAGLLRDAVALPLAPVSSRHHQGVDKPGEGLRVVARAPDGVIEAMELVDPAQRAFFLLVQWHPERMKGADRPFSSDILDTFIHAIQFESDTHPNSRR